MYRRNPANQFGGDAVQITVGKPLSTSAIWVSDARMIPENCAGKAKTLMRQKLSLENPALLREWDYEKNAALNPDDYSGGSNKKVWWRCAHGHSWYAQINKRFTFGRGCPYCSGNKVWPGFNDLVTTHSHIASEWDYEKNGDLLPEQFSIGADIKIWWKCEHNHSWQALIYSRKNCGCPVCARNILTVGVNDLQTINPALAAEWDFEKNTAAPDSVAANANKKAWWLCENGHSWKADISSRNSGRGCPYCNHRLVLQGFNDLLTAAPELEKEWDYDKNGGLRPEMVMQNSPRTVWWLCEHGHSWKTPIVSRRYGTGCPYCAKTRIIIGETDLKTQHPKLMKQWDYGKNMNYDPGRSACSSKNIVWWICEKGHSFKASIVNRVRGNGCPYCAGKRPIVGETDLATVHPELIPEWDFEKNGALLPIHVVTGSHKKAWWICKKGHSWRTSIYDRHFGQGCPYCSGVLAIPGETDVGTLNPSLVLEWDSERNDGIAFENIKQYSNKRVWWVCKRGHHWLSAVGARNAGSGCPHCHGKIPMRTRLVR